MSRRGFTVMELVMAIATGAVLAVVAAALFKAGILTYNYTARQSKVIESANKALLGQGATGGMMLAARTARAVSSLSNSTLNLTTPSGGATTFQISGGNLTQTTGGVTSSLALGLSTMTVSYYNVQSSGLIMQSTSAANATLVTVQVGMEKTYSKDKSYYFYSGAILRNHQ